MDHIASSYQSMQPQDSWARPAFPMRLSNDDVHVWRFWLKEPDQRVHELVEILSEEERIRAASLYSVEHRKRFVIGRGMLRTVLGSYLKTKPSQLELYYDSNGKPHLREDVTDKHALQFSLAHSHDLALCAVTLNRSLGIDLECVHDIPNIERAVNTFFSKQEADMIRMLPKSQKLKAFYDAWTRKEAYVKAIGARSCELFNITDTGLTSEKIDRSLWSIVPIEPALNYDATLVAEGHNFDLRYFNFGLSEKLIDISQMPKLT